MIRKSITSINRATNESPKRQLCGQFSDIEFFKKASLGPKFYEGKNSNLTVPQTDTGGLVEKTKVIERRDFKELGKKTGRKLARCPPRSVYMNGVQQKLLADCLTKTQVSAKPKGKV